jgi:ketol-acid reductoisomerase
MIGCDKLYGVTMQERGVSKHVAVAVDEVGKNGEIASSSINNVGEEALPIIETTSQKEVTHQ